MFWRALNVVMAVLFAVAVLVQYNDPDPVRWMLLYAAACGVALTVAARGTASPIASAIVGMTALAWAISWMTNGPDKLDLYRHMFDAWDMKSVPVEEARETSGLLIVAAWMAAVSFRTWMLRRSGSGSMRN